MRRVNADAPAAAGSNREVTRTFINRADHIIQVDHGKLALIAAAALLATPYSAGQERPLVTVLANSIDQAASSEQINALAAGGLDVTTISAADLPSHQTDTLILILGGHQAPEGVGDVVGGIIEEKEKEELVASPYARAVRALPNLWALNQTIIVFAGYSKEQTAKAFGDAEEDLIRIIKGKNGVYEADYTSGQQNASATDYSQLKVC
jgi:hypothetical protein